MTAAQRIYRRLPGRARSLLGVSSLWEGPDHLLLVEGRGYTERYRRFYYRDIASIVTRGTGTYAVGIALLASLLALSTLGLVQASLDLRPVWLSFAVLPAALAFAIHLAGGPTCRSELSTAIQTAPLPFRRWRTARKSIARIRERIAAAQPAPAPVAEAAPAAPLEPAASADLSSEATAKEEPSGQGGPSEPGERPAP